MQNPHLNFFVSLILCLAILSCNKQKGTEEDNLIGKWYADSIQVRQSVNSYATVYRYTSRTDYWDYRVDNKLYRLRANAYDTIPYTTGTDANGQRYVQYSPYSADSIKLLTNHLLIFIDPQGSSAKLFFSK